MVVTITSVLVVAVLVFIMLMVLKRRRREQRLKRLRGKHCSGLWDLDRGQQNLFRS